MTGATSSNKANNTTTGRLLVVVVVFLGFAFAAWWLFQSQGHQLHGTAMQPPVPLSDMVLVDENIEALPVDLLRGQWSLVMLADAECADTCQAQLELVRTVAGAFANSSSSEEDRLQRLLVMGFEPSREKIDQLREENPSLVMAVLTRPIWTVFTVQFTRAINALGDTAFFLVNPNGLVVAGYDDLAEAEGVIADLRYFQSHQ